MKEKGLLEKVIDAYRRVVKLKPEEKEKEKKEEKPK